MKSEIIERLGQADLWLPALIAEGLTANDRVKLRLSVLQAAARHAGEPSGARFDLARECHAAGIDHIALETLVNRAVMSAGEQISAPGLGALGAAIWDDVVAMIRAVKAGDTADGTKAEERLGALQKLAPGGTSDIVEFRDVMRLTAISILTATACTVWSWICTRRSTGSLPRMRRRRWPVRASRDCCQRTARRPKPLCAACTRLKSSNSVIPG
jgi:hypothetical protein